MKGLRKLDEGDMLVNKVIAEINLDVLSSSDKEKALDGVNIIKKKIYATIKGRTCVNRGNQRQCLSKEESIVSSTVSLHALFTTLIIDAYGKRDVATFYVLGTYLHKIC